ncbi:DC-STAMP domain-containing protein 2-like [Diadema antillarum]|uniref:DC-STAMP domain-containing protein 2-like n=1 Tax=Diadema antillarum TaxID=105358 RepID=UPI003A83F112
MDGKLSASLSQLHAGSNDGEAPNRHQIYSNLPLNGKLTPHPGHRLYTPQPPKRIPLKPPASSKPLFAKNSPTPPHPQVPGKSYGLKLKISDGDASSMKGSDPDTPNSSICNVNDSPTITRALKPPKAQFRRDNHQLGGNGTLSRSEGSHVITPDVPPSTANSPTPRHPRRDKKSPFGSLASVSKSLVASNEILNDILLSDRGTHKKLKGVVGSLMGGILGVLLFIGLYYGLAYGLYATLAITAISTVFMSLCLAFTVRFRCVAVLMIPTGCTSRGRAAFLAFIVALLLRGPVHNIFMNANEVSDSMSCSAELVYNQSREIQEVAQRILDSYVRAIQESISDTQDALEQVRMTFEPVENGLRAASRGIDTARRELLRAGEACNDVIGSARDSCVRELDGVYSRCQQALDRSILLQRADGICTPLRLSGSCSLLDVGRICDAPATIDETVDDALSDVRTALQTVVDTFDADVDFSRYFERRLNSSTTAEHIQEAIQEKLDHAYSYVELVLLYSDKILALSFVWLCIQSYMYHSSYRTKDSFDNQYITAQFKKLDASRKERGVPSILPLKKNERTRLIDVTSLRLCHSERGYFKFGLSTVIFHSIIAGLVLFVDFGLYWLLTTIRENGDVQIETSGELGSDVAIDGNGLLADFIRLFINEGFQAMIAFNASLDTTICLPEPVEPNSWLALTIGILYLCTILMVLSQAYAHRLLRYIAAYYYPEREEERITYLYDRTLQKRQTLASRLHDKIRNNKKEQDASNRISISAYLMRKCPCCKGLFTMCGVKQQRQCLGCLSRDDGLMVFCSDQDCEGMYCEECARALNGMCSVCDDTIDMGKMKLNY